MIGFAIAFALIGAILLAAGWPTEIGAVLIVVGAVLLLVARTRRSRRTLSRAAAFTEDLGAVVTEPLRSPPDARRYWLRLALDALRGLVGVWCVAWLVFGSWFGVFVYTGCSNIDRDSATCERAISTGLLLVMAAQAAVLVVALVFSAPHRRSRTQAISLTLGAVAPVVLYVGPYLVAYYVWG
jgi:MFS family permease